MRQFRSYASALCAVTVLLSGCAGGGPGGVGDAEPETETDKAATVVYMLGQHSKQDRATPMPYGVVPVRLPGTAVTSGDLPANRKRISDAVEALLHEPLGRHDTFWNGRCAPGDGVAGVRIGNGQVTVMLKGTAADDCDLDQAMTALQAEQLAWTVVENSDLPQDVAVSFVDGSGQTSERWVANTEMVVTK